LEALSPVPLNGVDFQAFLEFMETRAAHDEELWKECTEHRRARQRMNLYRGGSMHSPRS